MSTPEDWISWILNPNPQTWNEAVTALDSLTPESSIAIEPLVDSLDSQNNDLVFYCAVGLGRLKERSRPAIPKLLGLATEHPVPGVRSVALKSASKIAPNSSVVKDVIVARMEDPDYEVRATAITAALQIRKLLSKDDFDKIQSLQHDSEYWVRVAAEGAVRELFPPEVPGRPEEIVLPELIEISELAKILLTSPMRIFVLLVNMNVHIKLADSIDFSTAEKVCTKLGVKAKRA